VTRSKNPKQPPKPLNPTKLRDLALHYVGKYATSEAKLAAYLARKIRERGWADENNVPDVATLTQDFVRLGYIDDAAYAAARARSLIQRGYGLRRIAEDLRAKGISETAGTEARAESENDSWEAAHRFAKRKRIGPYATQSASPELRHKQLQAFLRAGHGFDVAKRFVHANPGEPPEPF
jgi:regulatory protein